MYVLILTVTEFHITNQFLFRITYKRNLAISTLRPVVNAMQFKEMNGIALSVDERKVLENAQTYLVN